MRPAYVAILFLVIALVLIGLARFRSDSNSNQQTPVARRVRQRTGAIFLLVATGLLLLDLLTGPGNL
jgi:hypothetical protein